MIQNKRGNKKTMSTNYEDIFGWKMWEHGIPDSRLIILEYMGDNKYLCECTCTKHTQFIADR